MGQGRGSWRGRSSGRRTDGLWCVVVQAQSGEGNVAQAEIQI